MTPFARQALLQLPLGRELRRIGVEGIRIRAADVLGSANRIAGVAGVGDPGRRIEIAASRVRYGILRNHLGGMADSGSGQLIVAGKHLLRVGRNGEA